MKVISYHPLSDALIPKQPAPLFTLEPLSDVIFHHTSLEEALSELIREGYIRPGGEIILKGIKDVLNNLKKLKAQWIFTSAPVEPQSTMETNGGPVKSSTSRDHTTREGHCGQKNVHPPSTPPLPSLTEKMTPPAELFPKIEQLEKELKRAYWGYELDSIDETLLKKLLGTEALYDWQCIKYYRSFLQNQGFTESGPTGLRLTPLGLQKIAWHILKEIFKTQQPFLSPRESLPSSSEPFFIEANRPYSFGDPLIINLSQSFLNALIRQGPTVPIRLEEQDFALYQQEPVSKSATVLLLDLSRSMRFEHRYVAAKKVALALHTLVQTRYPEDRLAVVGFSTKPYPIQIPELPFLTWDDTNPYTNMEEALDLAQQILLTYRGYRQQIFLITDGEPTAHREKGYLFFQFPPHPTTLLKTCKKLETISRRKIMVTFFLLSREKERIHYVHEIARRCGSKIFHLQPENLGQCLLMDYLGKKRKWL